MIPQIDNSIDDTNLVNEVILPSRTYKLSSNYETQIKYGETQNAVGEELTLTDAAEVKVKKLDIFGNLRQDETPTTSTGADINVVSGSNVIKTSNDNLFIPTLTYNGRNINQRNCVVTLNKDEFEFEALGTDMYFGYIGSTGTTFSNTYGVLYKVLDIKTINFTITNTIFNKNYIVKYDKNKRILGYQQFNSNSGTITFTNDVKYYSFRIGYGNAVVGTTYKTKIQLELGSSSTDYKPHQGKEFPLDLPVENLFDESLITNTSSSIKYIPIQCQANTDYTLSTNNVASSTATNLFLSTQDSGVTSANNGAYINSPRTINSGDNTTIYVGYRNDLSNNWIQLEKGSSANPYHPYGTDPIELCKIGNYRDYFYKSGSKWYLHKKIFKILLDGTENFDNTYTAFRYVSSKIKKSISGGGGICNYYLYNNRNSGMANLPNGYFAVQTLSSDKSSNLYFQNNNFETVDDFKNDLAEKYANGQPLVLYYPLETIVDVEITDTILISQLNNLQQLKAYQGISYIYNDNNIGPILDIDYYPLSSIYYETVQVDRISGFIDDLDAIRQAVYHILSIERYSCLIYDDNYGVELQQYIGQDFEYLKVTIQKTLEEALMQDERIISIDVIDIEKIDNETANVKLSIQANVGEIQMEVNINV